MIGEGDYPPPRAIKGIFMGSLLGTDFHTVEYRIHIEPESFSGQVEPELGDEVTIS